MLIQNKDIERRLLQDLKLLWENTPSYRCVFLRFSKLEIDSDVTINTLIQTLEEYFHDEVDDVYLCHDHDIFITSRIFTHKHVFSLLTHLKPKLGLASLEGLASIFELKVDWPKLRNLCEHKIIAKHDLEQKKLVDAQKKEEPAPISKAEVMQHFDVELVKSLSSRRNARKEAVIMVVEDDPFTQKLLHNTIGATYNLCIYKDGQSALLNYVIKAPDILFLDIGLPDMDGHIVLEKIFKLDPQAHVVMFSGNGDRANILKAVELGAKGFIGKPFTKNKIFQCIDNSPYVSEKTAH